MSCSVDTGYDHCFTMKTYVLKGNGQQVTYLEKQCGVAFVCNHPDTKFICTNKNATFTAQGHVMHNCTWRCCSTNMCNSDDLAIPAPTPVAVVPTPTPSANRSVIVNGSVIAEFSTPQTGSAPTTPPGCGAASVHEPVRMSITFAAMGQLTLTYFKMM